MERTLALLKTLYSCESEDSCTCAPIAISQLVTFPSHTYRTYIVHCQNSQWLSISIENRTTRSAHHPKLTRISLFRILSSRLSTVPQLAVYWLQSLSSVSILPPTMYSDRIISPIAHNDSHVYSLRCYSVHRVFVVMSHPYRTLVP